MLLCACDMVNNSLQELFGAIGPLKRANLLTRGQAEVAFIHKDHAVIALKKYHNRELDGKCTSSPSGWFGRVYNCGFCSFSVQFWECVKCIMIAGCLDWQIMRRCFSVATGQLQHIKFKQFCDLSRQQDSATKDRSMLFAIPLVNYQTFNTFTPQTRVYIITDV